MKLGGKYIFHQTDIFNVIIPYVFANVSAPKVIIANETIIRRVFLFTLLVILGPISPAESDPNPNAKTRLQLERWLAQRYAKNPAIQIGASAAVVHPIDFL